MADPAGLSRLFAGPFPALEERLLSRLPGHLRAAPGEERVVLVPSNELREHLLKRIASRWEGDAAGVSLATLYDFARRLLKHRGLFPRELPPAQAQAALRAAVEEVYGGGEGDFAAISGTDGFLPALSRTLADLEEGWIGGELLREAERREAVRGRPRSASRFAEWRRLAAAADRAVRAMGGMTRRRIFQEAVRGFEQPGYPFRAVLYGFYDFTRLQWTLVDALLGSGLLEEVYFPALFREDGTLLPSFSYAAGTWERILRVFEGNAEHLPGDPGGALGELRGRMFSRACPVGEAVPAPLTILSPPHDEGEARLAARCVREWLDAAPGEEILLAYRRFAEEAAEDWERAAEEFGIPQASRRTVPLASVPPVRLFLLLLRAAQERFPRRETIEILSSPYLRHAPAPPGGVGPRPDLWEGISRERLVVGGDDWETRLAKAGRGGRDGEEARGRGEREDREMRAAQIRLLRREVRRLREAVRPVLRSGGWERFSAALRDLLASRFALPDDGSPETERDRRALSDLSRILDDAGRIPPGAVRWPGAEEACGWLSALVSSQGFFAGVRGGLRARGNAVAGDLHGLRGITADRVILLGATADRVPAPVDEDPLLPDADRELLNLLARQAGLPDALSRVRQSASREKLLFALPAAQARTEVAFSVARADEAGAARRPSRYLLDLLSSFAGPSVYSERWEVASGARVRRLPRAPFRALREEGAVSPRERALLAWLSGLPAEDALERIPWGRIAGILAALRERGEGRSLFPVSVPRQRRRRGWSASELDTLALCPYRHFLRYRLGLLPLEEPESEAALSPADRGTILHEILRILGREAARGKGWGDPGQAARKARARFARENPGGLPGLFAIACRAVERDARAYVEEARRAGDPSAFRVEAVEQPFSLPAREGIPALSGRVDRIDRGPGGLVRVVDYKYRDGEKERPPLERIAHGLANQVPVYLSFAASRESSRGEVRADLLFLRNGVRAVSVEGAQWKAVRPEWIRSVADWIAIASAGVLPPLPHHRFSFAGSAPPRYCDSCPYRDHCRVCPGPSEPEAQGRALVRAVEKNPGLRALREHRPARGR